MAARYLLDTNVVLDFMGNKLPSKARNTMNTIIDTEINLSAVNKMELLGFATVEQDLVDFIRYSDVLPIDDIVVDKTIEIRRMYKIKLPDAIIAATALVHGLTLVSHNIKDFRRISTLRLIDLYTE